MFEITYFLVFFVKNFWSSILFVIKQYANNVSHMLSWLYLNRFVFTELHGMQTQSSDENSVCLSIKCVNCDKTEEKSVQILYHMII